MEAKEIKLVARPWQPQDLIDDLQDIIDEESDNYLNTRRTTLCMAMDYLKEYFAPDKYVGSKWISVKERLPEKGEWVLCVGAKGGLFLADIMSVFSDGSCYCHVPNSRGGRYATHWMPLPEAPKENDDG